MLWLSPSGKENLKNTNFIINFNFNTHTVENIMGLNLLT